MALQTNLFTFGKHSAFVDCLVGQPNLDADEW